MPVSPRPPCPWHCRLVRVAPARLCGAGSGRGDQPADQVELIHPVTCGPESGPRASSSGTEAGKDGFQFVGLPGQGLRGRGRLAG